MRIFFGVIAIILCIWFVIALLLQVMAFINAPDYMYKLLLAIIIASVLNVFLSWFSKF